MSATTSPETAASSFDLELVPGAAASAPVAVSRPIGQFMWGLGPQNGEMHVIDSLQPDFPSSKARLRQTVALRELCRKYNTSLERSNLIVCEGRKIVHVLRIGEITSPACFSNEVPTGSYRDVKDEAAAARSESIAVRYPAWNSVLIPDGWKIAVVVDNEPWTAETRVHQDVMQYRFIKVKDDGEENWTTGASEWCETPGAAFKSIFSKFHPDKEVSRHNGKLYIGCHYEHVQGKLRDFFERKYIAKMYENDAEISDLIRDWLKNDRLAVTTKRRVKRMEGGASTPHVSKKVKPDETAYPDEGAEASAGPTKKQKRRKAPSPSAPASRMSSSSSAPLETNRRGNLFDQPLYLGYPDIRAHELATEIENDTTIWGFWTSPLSSDDSDLASDESVADDPFQWLDVEISDADDSADSSKPQQESLTNNVYQAPILMGDRVRGGVASEKSDALHGMKSVRTTAGDAPGVTRPAFKMFPGWKRIEETTADLSKRLESKDFTVSALPLDDVCKLVKLVFLRSNQNRYNDEWVKAIVDATGPTGKSETDDVIVETLINFLKAVEQYASTTLLESSASPPQSDSEFVNVAAFVERQRRERLDNEYIIGKLRGLRKPVALSIITLMPPSTLLEKTWRSIVLKSWLRVKSRTLFPGALRLSSPLIETKFSNATFKKSMLGSLQLTPLKVEEVWEFVKIVAGKTGQELVSPAWVLGVFEMVEPKEVRTGVSHVRMEGFIQFLREVEDFTAKEVYPSLKNQSYSKAITSSEQPAVRFVRKQLTERLDGEFSVVRMLPLDRFVRIMTLLPSSRDMEREWQAICASNKSNFLAVFQSVLGDI